MLNFNWWVFLEPGSYLAYPPRCRCTSLRQRLPHGDHADGILRRGERRRTLGWTTLPPPSGLNISTIRPRRKPCSQRSSDAGWLGRSGLREGTRREWCNRRRSRFRSTAGRPFWSVPLVVFNARSVPRIGLVSGVFMPTVSPPVPDDQGRFEHHASKGHGPDEQEPHCYCP